jgi:hypothetical protein
MKSENVINQLDALKNELRANPSSVQVIGPQIKNAVSAVRRSQGQNLEVAGQPAAHCFGAIVKSGV